MIKAPSTLHTKLQKMQLSSIHTMTFFHNCYDFFNSCIYRQQSWNDFLAEKSLKFCVMWEGLQDSNDQVWFNIFGFMTKFCHSSLLGTWEKCGCSANVLAILNHLLTNKRIWCLFIMVCYVMYVIFNYLHVWEKSEPLRW